MMRRRSHRRGFVIVVAIVVFAISMTLFALWARAAVYEHRRAIGREHRAQAVRLAEAGLARADARLAADMRYEGETWSIPAAELGGNHAAEVRIRITPADDGLGRQFESSAEFPVGNVRRAQVTKRRVIPHQVTGNES